MGRRINYNVGIYEMLEEADNKIFLLTKENKKLKLDYSVLNSDYNNLKQNIDNKIKIEVEKETKPLLNKVSEQEKKLIEG